MYVLITTAHRGVFFGELVGEPTKEKVTLRECRNCVSWDVGIKGFLGLAIDGPSDKCRVGPAAHEMTLYDITSVAKVTEKAVRRWQSEPWC